MTDLARRFPQNPLLRPSDLKPSRPDWQVECLLNPGAFRFDGRTWLLVRVAERPPQREGYVSLPVLCESGEARVLEFDRKDPPLDLSDPRVLRYDGVHYLDQSIRSGERWKFRFFHQRSERSLPVEIEIKRHDPKKITAMKRAIRTVQKKREASGC